MLLISESFGDSTFSMFCTSLSLLIANVVAGLVLAVLNYDYKIPFSNNRSGNFEKVQVYYLQDLEKTEHTWGYTVRLRVGRRRGKSEREREWSWVFLSLGSKVGGPEFCVLTLYR